MKRKSIIEKAMKVLKYIEENPNTYLRDISRSLGINPATVHRILKELTPFLEFTSVNDQLKGVELPNLPTFIRLKEGYTVEGILKYLKVKEKLNFL